MVRRPVGNALTPQKFLVLDWQCVPQAQTVPLADTPPQGLPAAHNSGARRAAHKEIATMWRSMFLALGAYCCLLGAESFVVERAILKVTTNGPGQAPSWREVSPPEGAGFLVMGAGAIVMLYSFTVPQKLHGG